MVRPCRQAGVRLMFGISASLGRAAPRMGQNAAAALLATGRWQKLNDASAAVAAADAGPAHVGFAKPPNLLPEQHALPMLAAREARC